MKNDKKNAPLVTVTHDGRRSINPNVLIRTEVFKEQNRLMMENFGQVPKSSKASS